VKWLPPVLVAILINPTTALPAAIVILIGWFINMNILAPLVAPTQHPRGGEAQR